MSGLILVRELDERLGFGEHIEQHLTDTRGKNAQLPFADLLRQWLYSRLAGYEDVNDAERVGVPNGHGSNPRRFPRLVGRRQESDNQSRALPALSHAEGSASSPKALAGLPKFRG
ncbi:MAG: hypothetical protein A3G20_05715 [Acidobacteria bacterium RIFCSPLOWO2_12_FULL_59_11]|nr:MAG: hypothetical protein A3G20_05715 [Acidobacteria bacterium RIFCSPLOWO2_12_FULL_59_11]